MLQTLHQHFQCWCLHAKQEPLYRWGNSCHAHRHSSTSTGKTVLHDKVMEINRCVCQAMTGWQIYHSVDTSCIACALLSQHVSSESLSHYPVVISVLMSEQCNALRQRKDIEAILQHNITTLFVNKKKIMCTSISLLTYTKYLSLCYLKVIICHFFFFPAVI